ncbi:MAG: transposase [Microcoleus sp.]
MEDYGQVIGNYKKNKSLVVGILQRNGKVRMKKIENAYRKTFHKFIKDHAAPDTKNVITDEHPAYVGIADQDTKHETVNHKKKSG